MVGMFAVAGANAGLPLPLPLALSTLTAVFCVCSVITTSLFSLRHNNFSTVHFTNGARARMCKPRL